MFSYCGLAMGKRIPFNEYYQIKDDYQRFDARKTAFSIKRSKFGSDTFSYTKKVWDKMQAGVPGFSHPDISFKNAANTSDNHEGMNTGYYSWFPLDVSVKPDHIPRWEKTPYEHAKVIRKAAQYYGAVNVGYTTLDERWIYSHTSDGRPIVVETTDKPYVGEDKIVIPESYKYVIAIAVPMEFNENSYAPTPIEVTSNMGYARMHVVTGTLAEFIRGLGWNAIPCGNDTALSVPIAIQAGLGHLGRNGRLITWENGPLVRIAKIFTDMPLPQSLPASSGIVEYCEVCAKCAKECPSQSIPLGPRSFAPINESNNGGVYKWQCDEQGCFDYWHEVATGCSICFRVCSFTKSKGLLHDIVKWFIRNAPIFNKFFVWSDEVFGYGKMSDPKKYWDIPFKRS
jgi:reductive dehalogenase